jgi:hypothetical protein
VLRLISNAIFPADINLLWDAIRKTIQYSVQLCTAHDLTEWYQNRHLFRTIKKSYRQIQKLKHSICKDETKRQVKQDEINPSSSLFCEKSSFSALLAIKNI